MTDLPQAAPDELTLRMADTLNAERWGSEHDAIGRHDRHGFYAPCGICRGDLDEILALLVPVVKAREAEIERQVRERVAAEIEAAAPECTVLTGAQTVHRAKGMHHAARIARGES